MSAATYMSALSRLSTAVGSREGCGPGTVPVPLCVGMAAAVDIARTPEAIQERQRSAQLRDSFVQMLQAGPFQFAINGHAGEWRHPGNANLRFDGLSAQDILGKLQPWVAASAGAACASGIPEPSHVLRALGLSAEQADSSVRFSFGTVYNCGRDPRTSQTSSRQPLNH